MAASTITNDVRRTDLRTNVYETPYWITSGDLGQTKGAIVAFSFPTAGLITFVLGFVVQITTAYTAGSTFTVGTGTLALDTTTTAGDVEIVDVDEYILAADVTATTAGYYGPTTGTGSDWLTARVAYSYAAPLIITGVASVTVPCVYATLANAGAVSAGAARIHMLITNVPGK
jgi:hypothetical protein